MRVFNAGLYARAPLRDARMGEAMIVGKDDIDLVLAYPMPKCKADLLPLIETVRTAATLAERERCTAERAQAYDQGVADELARHSMPVDHFDVLLELYPITVPSDVRSALLEACRHTVLMLAMGRGDFNVPLLAGVEPSETYDTEPLCKVCKYHQHGGHLSIYPPHDFEPEAPP